VAFANPPQGNKWEQLFSRCCSDRYLRLPKRVPTSPEVADWPGL